MNEKVRIEVDEVTAELLKARAAARGITVAGLLADLLGAEEALSADLQEMRRSGTGPWASDALAEDARRLEQFRRTREAVPWDDMKAWLATWGTSDEAPAPTPRKL